MIAISARIKEPTNEKTPTSTQAAMTMPNSARDTMNYSENVAMSLATACGFLKTPEPMTVPMTMAVAIQGPRTRGSWLAVGGESGMEGSWCSMANIDN